MITNALKELEAKRFHFVLARRDARAGRDLSLKLDRTSRIGKRDILLVACLRNERPRMEAFARHHRALGVDHFLLIDNDSDDGFMDWAERQPDVSVWHTRASFRDSSFGMLWCNALLRRHGVDHWCVIVDPDEFLIHPCMETRGLRALTEFLDDEERPCMHAVQLDAYSGRPLSETVLRDGDDPFAICPYFDGDGYIQVRGWGGSNWIRGGPRLRVHFRDDPSHAPALNKIPLVRWRRGYHYRMSAHDARPLKLNEPGEAFVTGVLFHFKFVASLRDKAVEEAGRGEHFAGGREYLRYREEQVDDFFVEGISRRYSGPKQLIELGLMSQGRWF